MAIKNVTVAGSGVLGSQIAFQAAFKGFNVTVYDINEDAINKAKDRIKGLRHSYKHDVAATDADFEKGLTNISYSGIWKKLLLMLTWLLKRFLNVQISRRTSIQK